MPPRKQQRQQKPQRADRAGATPPLADDAPLHAASHATTSSGKGAAAAAPSSHAGRHPATPQQQTAFVGLRTPRDRETTAAGAGAGAAVVSEQCTMPEVLLQALLHDDELAACEYLNTNTIFCANTRWERSVTPLMLAAGRSMLAPAVLLLLCQADVSATDDDGRTAADYAMEAGNAVLALMLQALQPTKGEEGEEEAVQGAGKAAGAAAQAGGGPSAPAAGTAATASAKGHLEHVGTAVWIRFASGLMGSSGLLPDLRLTPLMLAALHGALPPLRFMLQKQPGPGAVREGRAGRACSIGFGDIGTAMNEVLCAAGTVNATDKLGRTALHYAARCFHDGAAAVRLLVSAGAALEVRDVTGVTPLATAVLNDNAATARALLAAGADLKAGIILKDRGGGSGGSGGLEEGRHGGSSRSSGSGCSSGSEDEGRGSCGSRGRDS